MSLTTLNENEPTGFQSVDRGAGEIRITRKDVKDSLALQHYLSGEHRFPPASTTASALGQIALDDGRLLYGTGPGWQTSSVHLQSATGAGGTTYPYSAATQTVLGLDITTRFTGWVVMVAVMCKGTKPAGMSSVDFEAGIWLSGTGWPTASRAFYLPCTAFTPSPAATETTWCPIFLSFYDLTSSQLQVGTNVSFRIKVLTSSGSITMINHVNIVVMSA